MEHSVSSVIHPTAIVEPGAELGERVRIGPFCHVGPHAKLGDDVELMSHVVVIGDTELGAGTRVFPHAVLGAEPQNTAHGGSRTLLRIGCRNTIREGVTMHTGTDNARGETVVGDDCMFLAYSHVAHDCVLGNNVTFANNVMIGGHTTVGDRVIIGGGAGVHQFCRIGHHAFVGGLAAVQADVIPFGMIQGNRGYLAGLNLVGMKRSGMNKTEVTALRHAFKTLFHGAGSLRENASQLVAGDSVPDPVKDVANFILIDSKRKFMTPLSSSAARQDIGD